MTGSEDGGPAVEIEQETVTTQIPLQTAAAPALPRDRTEARARAVIFHLAWLLPCLAVYAWFFSTQFQGLRLADAMDAAQVGRHVSEGDGFVTSFVRPFSLGKVPNVSDHPDLYNPPVYPLVLAIAFNLFGANDRTVGLVSGLFGLVTVLLTYLLGARLLDRRAGALAAVLLCFHMGLLNAGISGLSITLLAFLVVLLFYLILRHPDTLRWSALCGAICGLAYLTEYSALLLALPTVGLVFLGQRRTRLRHVGVFAAGFVVVILPWLIRNWNVAGTPFAMLKSYGVAMHGTSFPLTSLYRHPASSLDDVMPLAFAVGHMGEVGKKLLANLGSLQSGLPGILGLCLLPLLGLALFLDLGRPAANRMKWALLIGTILMGISLAAGQPRADALHGLIGVAAALGAAGFVLALGARGPSRGTTAAATVGLLALAVFPVALHALPGARGTKPDRRNLEYLGRALPKDAVVVTDQGPGVAWYSDHIAVWIPQAAPPRPKEGEQMLLVDAADATQAASFEALERGGVKPDAIFLSSELPRWPADEGVGRWQLLHDVIAKQLDALQRGQAEGTPWTPPGWTLAASLPPRDFLLVRADIADQQEGVEVETDSEQGEPEEAQAVP